MAIIDPDGLFNGERLAACSDLAQLYWPRFFLAANGCGRLELAYKSLISRVFGNFHKIPESSEIWAIFREYEANCLVVIYEATNGWWCQFVTSEKYLPRFKTMRDLASPSPPLDIQEKARKGYLEWKKAKSIKNQSFQKLSENFGGRGVGGGEGVGVGEGISGANAPSSPSPRQRVSEGEKKRAKKKRNSPPTKTDEAKARHALFKAAIFDYWKSKNTDIDCPWQEAEGSQLEMWLRSSPNTSLPSFVKMLRNRYRSEVVHSDRPSLWIKNITSFANGPLDRYGKPLEGGNRNGRSTAQSKQERTVAEVKKAIAGIRQVDHAGTGQDGGGDERGSEFGMPLFHD